MAGRAEVPRFGVPAVNGGPLGPQPRRVGRAAIYEEAPPVISPNILLAVLDDAGKPGRLAPVPPDRLALAGVVVVRPDEEVEPFEGELEGRVELVRLAFVALGSSELAGLDGQLDDDGRARRPGPLQAFDGAGRGLDRLAVDHHALAGGPRCRDGTARADDHAAPELAGARRSHGPHRSERLRHRSFTTACKTPTPCPDAVSDAEPAIARLPRVTYIVEWPLGGRLAGCRWPRRSRPR